jgi:transposase
MGKPYSQDLRDRVIASVEDGLAITACARLMRVSVAYVSKVMSRKRSTGETAALPLGHGPAPKLAAYEAVLRQRVAAQPDETLEELSGWLRSEHAVEVSVAVLCRTLQRLDLTRKKRRSMPASRSAPMSPPGAPLGRQRSPA